MKSLHKYFLITFLIIMCGGTGTFGQGFFGKKNLLSYNLLTNNVREQPNFHMFSSSLKFRFTHSIEVEHLAGKMFSYGGNVFLYSTKFSEYYFRSDIFLGSDPMRVQGLGIGGFVKAYWGNTAPFGNYFKLQFGQIFNRVKGVRRPWENNFPASIIEMRLAVMKQVPMGKKYLFKYGLEGGIPLGNPTSKDSSFRSSDRLTLGDANTIQNILNISIAIIRPF